MDITLSATADEAAFIIHVVGQLPTQANAWPLYQKLKAQFDTQAKVAQEPAPADAAA